MPPTGTVLLGSRGRPTRVLFNTEFQTSIAASSFILLKLQFTCDTEVDCFFANSKESTKCTPCYACKNAAAQGCQSARPSPHPIISPISSALCLSMPSLILINTPAANIFTSFSSPPSSPLVFPNI